MWQLYIGLFVLCIGMNIQPQKTIKQKLVMEDNDYGHFIYMD